MNAIYCSDLKTPLRLVFCDAASVVRIMTDAISPLDVGPPEESGLTNCFP